MVSSGSNDRGLFVTVVMHIGFRNKKFLSVVVLVLSTAKNALMLVDSLTCNIPAGCYVPRNNGVTGWPQSL
jgi:hypothetical protein